MALAPLNLSDVQQSVAIVDQDGRPVGFFIRLLNQNNMNIKAAFAAIVANIESTATAQAAADAAQDSAISAIADAAAASANAAAAQSDATDALGIAGTAVQQDLGPAWTAPTGTASRVSFATYTAPVISASPTQAEVQAVANAVQALSRALKAVVDDLTANGALTL